MTLTYRHIKGKQSRHTKCAVLFIAHYPVYFELKRDRAEGRKEKLGERREGGSASWEFYGGERALAPKSVGPKSVTPRKRNMGTKREFVINCIDQ